MKKKDGVTSDPPSDANGQPVYPPELLGRAHARAWLNERRNVLADDLARALTQQMDDERSGRLPALDIAEDIKTWAERVTTQLRDPKLSKFELQALEAAVTRAWRAAHNITTDIAMRDAVSAQIETVAAWARSLPENEHDGRVYLEAYEALRLVDRHLAHKIARDGGKAKIVAAVRACNNKGGRGNVAPTSKWDAINAVIEHVGLPVVDDPESLRRSRRRKGRTK